MNFIPFNKCAASGIEHESLGELPVVTLKPGEVVTARLLPSFVDGERPCLTLWGHVWPDFCRYHAYALCTDKTDASIFCGEESGPCPACRAGLPLRWTGLVYALIGQKGRPVCLKFSQQNFPVLKDLVDRGCFSFAHGRTVQFLPNDNWKLSYTLLGERPVDEGQFRSAMSIDLLHVKPRQPNLGVLEAMAKAKQGWINAGRIEPQPGQYQALVELLPNSTLIRIPWGMKGPRDVGWQNTPFELMLDYDYRRELEDGNIGLLCGLDRDAVNKSLIPNLLTIGLDADDDDFADMTMKLNPALKDTFTSYGARAPKWFFHLPGELADRLGQSTKIMQRRGGHHVEVGDWLASGKQGVILGLHPDGLLYKHNGKPVALLETLKLPRNCYLASELDDIAQGASKSRRRGPHGSGSILDMKRLRNLHRTAKGTEARCPACEEIGKDKAGDNLLIFPDGRFQCAAYINVTARENHNHNRRIYELAGAERNDYASY
ncbi:MAG: hypothetical protein AB9869_38480 [Verrucomicrobiia bacterium]